MPPSKIIIDDQKAYSSLAQRSFTLDISKKLSNKCNNPIHQVSLYQTTIIFDTDHAKY